MTQKKKTINPHFWKFKKNVTYIKKECILGAPFKFQLNKIIIAPVTAFQRKLINLFGTVVVTLNTVRIYLGIALQFLKFCY